MTIITAIDLRGSHGCTRDQGNRPTCLAFALSDLNGHRHQQPALLSPGFLYREAASLMSGWRPGDGLDVHAAIRAAAIPGQPLDKHCPYESSEPSLPLAPNAGYAPMFNGIYALRRPDMTHIAETLGAGRSLGLIVNVTPELYLVERATAQVTFTPNVMPGMSHAVLAVGVGTHARTQESHVLIRNSWGATWGDNGHAWLPERYVVTHGIFTLGD